MKMMPVRVFPSVLDVPRDQIQSYMDDIIPFVDGISFDIMDGQFVPPTSFTLDDFRQYSVPKTCEVHLMIQHPDRVLTDWIDAGADMVTIHYESLQESVEGSLKMIRALGAKAALAIKPNTPIESIDPLLFTHCDMVLIMSVEPGWGGQSFIPGVLDKVRWLRSRFPTLDIGIDGGINSQTGPIAVDAGCTLLVSGSYLFKSSEREASVRALISA